MYAVTIDIDWAPDQLIEYTRSLLDAAGVPATFFATHRHGVALPGHEIAIHPNILGRIGEGRSYEQAIRDVYAQFPLSRGVRAHSLCVSTRFYPVYRSCNLEYESGVLCYGVQNLKPYWMIERVVQLPLFFEDDLHMELAAEWGHRPFRLEELRPEKPGLKIFGFHPVHLWLNTDSLEQYNRAKQHYQNPEALRTLVNSGEGVRTLFLNLLAWLKGRDPKTLAEIAASWKNDQERNLS